MGFKKNGSAKCDLDPLRNLRYSHFKVISFVALISRNSNRLNEFLMFNKGCLTHNRAYT
jgi:hypothetical protein